MVASLREWRKGLKRRLRGLGRRALASLSPKPAAPPKPARPTATRPPPAPPPPPLPAWVPGPRTEPAEPARLWKAPAGKFWPEGVEPIPYMTSHAERRFYYELTRTRYREQAAIVELGPWLGAGTAHLAAGLRDRGSETQLLSIDRFTWIGSLYNAKLGQEIRHGDDFEPLFRANLGPLAPWVRSERANIRSYVWTGGEIELLIADAPKIISEVIQLLRGFGHALVPGLSLLSCQDYLHSPSYALPFILGEIDELVPDEVVMPGSTVTFRLERPIDLDPSRLAWLDLPSWNEARVDAAWQRLHRLLPVEAHDQLSLSLPMFLHDIGAVARAVDETGRIADLPIVRHRLGKWAQSSIHARYQPLFAAAGIAFEAKAEAVAAA